MMGSIGSDEIDCPVLFVDDDRAMVNSTVQWLKLSGIQVRAFSEPLALLRTIKPDMPIVVISDIRMPEMDGIELLAQIKNKDEGIPVILITGHGDVPLAVEAMKAGAFEFLTKPFSPDQLLDYVKQAQASRVTQLGAKQENNQINVKSLVENVKEKRAELEASIHGDLHNDDDLSTRIALYEKTIIEDVLYQHNGNIGAVLAQLSIPRRTLNEKMKKHNIVSKDYKK
ncbi:MAG: response regulator [Rhizobiales bacterium]|nr:response regulator [Hyphomicrobiales bacterium]